MNSAASQNKKKKKMCDIGFNEVMGKCPENVMVLLEEEHEFNFLLFFSSCVSSFPFVCSPIRARFVEPCVEPCVAGIPLSFGTSEVLGESNRKMHHHEEDRPRFKLGLDIFQPAL